MNTFKQFSRFFWLLRLSVGVAVVVLGAVVVVEIIRCYDPATRPMEILTAGQHHIISVSFSLVSINVENWILEASIWFGVYTVKETYSRTWVWRLRHTTETFKKTHTHKLFFFPYETNKRCPRIREKKSSKIKIKTKIHISSGVVRRISIFFSLSLPLRLSFRWDCCWKNFYWK